MGYQNPNVLNLITIHVEVNAHNFAITEEEARWP